MLKHLRKNVNRFQITLPDTDTIDYQQEFPDEFSVSFVDSGLQYSFNFTVSSTTNNFTTGSDIYISKNSSIIEEHILEQDSEVCLE